MPVVAPIVVHFGASANLYSQLFSYYMTVLGCTEPQDVAVVKVQEDAIHPIPQARTPTYCVLI